jgi:integral membrane protein (TIGR01906 family)
MSRLYPILSWLITLAVPFLLIMTAVRLLLNPALLQFEYKSPNFPPDTYGFTIQDRLKWGGLSLDYLLNNADISFLADLKFSDGTPIYNDRELSHMADVKLVIQHMTTAWYIIIGALLALGVWAWLGHWMVNFWQGISRGGWLTIALIAIILVFVFTSFDSLFTDFHRIFFTGNSWIFLYSDTLIRLFPLPFWQNAFIFMGGITVVGALLFGYGGQKLAGRF